MRAKPSHRIDRRAIVFWQLRGLIDLVFFAVSASTVATVLVLTADIPWWGLLLFSPPLIVYAALTLFVFPRIRWSVWCYELDEHELDFQHGLIVVRRTLVPLVRVQHVDTVQGPIAKLFRLSTVTVSTAASTHEIPALSDEVADELRDRISAMARRAREQL